MQTRSTKRHLEGEKNSCGKRIVRKLTFRSLSDLQTEHFQALGAEVWGVIEEGVKEINEKKQSLRACATEHLIKRFNIAYFNSCQYAVNMEHWIAQEKLSKEAYKKYDRVWEKSDIHDETMFRDYVIAATQETKFLKEACVGLTKVALP